MVERDRRERRNTLVWRILRWYLLIIEVMVIVLGVHLLSTGRSDDRSLGFFCLLLGGIALVCHVIAGVVIRRNKNRS